MKVRITGLGHLKNLDEEKLKTIFIEFGEIENIELPRSIRTGNHEGVAFITYKKRKSGEEAIRAMDKMTLKGEKIRVKEASEEAEDEEDLEEAHEKMISGAGGKGSQSICLLINNMFDPLQVNLTENPEFYEEIYQ